jgi:hypothetical protein
MKIAPTLIQLQVLEALNDSSEISPLLEDLDKNVMIFCQRFVSLFGLFAEITTKAQSQTELTIVEVPSWISQIGAHLLSKHHEFEGDFVFQSAVRILRSKMDEKFEWVGNIYVQSYHIRLLPSSKSLRFEIRQQSCQGSSCVEDCGSVHVA